jgi:hypothetical protein
MNLKEYSEWLPKATLSELTDKVIMETILEATAWCGWTDKARESLVKETQNAVRWAIDMKSPKETK